MQWLEIRIGNQAYACGDAFTVPDIIIGHCADWARSAKFIWPEVALEKYISRLNSRDVYKKARAIRTS